MNRAVATLTLGIALVIGLPAVSLADSGMAAWDATVVSSSVGIQAVRHQSDVELPPVRIGIDETELSDDDLLPVIDDDSSTSRFFLDADPSDTTNHGAEVNWMGTSGISEGWKVSGGRESRGTQKVKRCDFAAFMYRLADLKDDGKINGSVKLSKSVKSLLAGVSDCTTSTSHAKEIAWLIDTGISKGWQDKGKKTVSFKPGANVARQDMAAFLYRFADWKDDKTLNGSPKKGTEKITFSDVKSGDSANHASEVQWLASVGISTGWGTGSKREFRGRQDVARQDMAAFMHRLNKYLG